MNGKAKVDALAHVLWEIKVERERQDATWGTQCHGPRYWLCILMEEVGEAARATIADTVDAAQYRRELVHVAAVAAAAIESYDRGDASGAEIDRA